MERVYHVYFFFLFRYFSLVQLLLSQIQSSSSGLTKLNESKKGGTEEGNREREEIEKEGEREIRERKKEGRRERCVVLC